MNRIISSKWVYFALRFILGSLFIYAGATKLMDVLGFAATIDQYGLVSWRMANLIAKTLPVLEILAGFGLILDIRGALGVIVAQLLGFVCVLAYGIYLGLDVDCGCFGPADAGAAESGSLWGTLIRDLFMLGACALIYLQRNLAGFRLRSVFGVFHKIKG